MWRPPFDLYSHCPFSLRFHAWNQWRTTSSFGPGVRTADAALCLVPGHSDEWSGQHRCHCGYGALLHPVQAPRNLGDYFHPGSVQVSVYVHVCVCVWGGVFIYIYVCVYVCARDSILNCFLSCTRRISPINSVNGISLTLRTLPSAFLSLLLFLYSHVFAKFDNVLLLWKGRTVFFGSPEKLEVFFAEQNHPTPALINPSDHMSECAGHLSVACTRPCGWISQRLKGGVLSGMCGGHPPTFFSFFFILCNQHKYSDCHQHGL